MNKTELNRFPESYGPIPEPMIMAGWKEVPIKESGHPLVSLNELSAVSSIILSPQYNMQGIEGASSELFLRNEAASRLVFASELLPKEFSLIVFDAYRPFRVQTEIFNSFKNYLRSQSPDIDEEELIKRTEIYVSLPSTDIQRPSPHATGGSIDLSIVDVQGNLLDMGSEFDSFELSSQTAFFRNKDDIYHKNRELLFHVMIKAGFTNYPEEWWHYDFGNQFWAHLSAKMAIYGLAEGGEIYARKRN